MLVYLAQLRKTQPICSGIKHTEYHQWRKVQYTSFNYIQIASKNSKTNSLLFIVDHIECVYINIFIFSWIAQIAD